MNNLLITHATVLTLGVDCQVLEDHSLLIENGRITAIQPASQLSTAPDVTVINAGGQLLMPASICAHTHFYGAYARGMAIPGPAPEDFPAILRRLWWNLDKALDADAVRLSAQVMLADAIRHGTTTIFDHHASPEAIDGSLDLIAREVEAAGLRAVLCYEVTDRDGPDRMHAGIAENLRFLRDYADHPQLRGAFGLHASLTLNDEALRACAEAAPSETGFHIHVAEHEADEEDSLQRSGLRVVPRLEAYGIWRDNSIAAHCVHITPEERRHLRERGVWVTHQPRSNMNNAVGAAAIDEMLNEGMRLCLGNDGFSFNMWAEWKAAYFLHKVAHRDPRRANGADIARMATGHNAMLAERYFGGAPLGMIAPGARADVILVDYQPFTPFTAGNWPWHLIFGFEASMITTTICEGRVLMRDRQLLTVDEQAIMAEARAHAPSVWERYTRRAQNDLQS